MSKKRISSVRKGKAFERLAAKWLRTFGIQAERSQQHTGNAGHADLILRNLPHVFVEVKAEAACKIGTQRLREIVKLASIQADKGGANQFFVLWRQRGQWFTSTYDHCGMNWIITRDERDSGSMFARMLLATKAKSFAETLVEESGATP